MKIKLILVTPVLLITACSTPSQRLLNTAALADSATTYYGINSGKSKEANPLLPSSAAGAAGVSALIKIGAPALTKQIYPRACTIIYRSMVSSGVTGATSNLATLSSVPFESAIGLGITGGIAAALSTRKYAEQYCTKP